MLDIISEFSLKNLKCVYCLFQLVSLFLTPILGLVAGPKSILVLSGVLINTVSFVKAADYVFLLSKYVLFGSEALAFKATLAFCLSPASIFFTAIYTESLYAVCFFGALWHMKKQDRVSLGSAFFLFLASATRSNGMVSLGFVVYNGMVNFAGKVYEVVEGQDSGGCRQSVAICRQSSASWCCNSYFECSKNGSKCQSDFGCRQSDSECQQKDSGSRQSNSGCRKRDSECRQNDSNCLQVVQNCRCHSASGCCCNSDFFKCRQSDSGCLQNSADIVKGSQFKMTSLAKASWQVLTSSLSRSHTWSHLMVFGLNCLACVMPFVLFQGYVGYKFCQLRKNGASSYDWCLGGGSGLRFSYTAVQDKFWNVGFLKYWVTSNYVQGIMVAPVLSE